MLIYVKRFNHVHELKLHVSETHSVRQIKQNIRDELGFTADDQLFLRYGPKNKLLEDKQKVSQFFKPVWNYNNISSYILYVHNDNNFAPYTQQDAQTILLPSSKSSAKPIEVDLVKMITASVVAADNTEGQKASSAELISRTSSSSANSSGVFSHDTTSVSFPDHVTICADQDQNQEEEEDDEQNKKNFNPEILTSASTEETDDEEHNEVSEPKDYVHVSIINDEKNTVLEIINSYLKKKQSKNIFSSIFKSPDNIYPVSVIKSFLENSNTTKVHFHFLMYAVLKNNKISLFRAFLFEEYKKIYKTKTTLTQLTEYFKECIYQHNKFLKAEKYASDLFETNIVDSFNQAIIKEKEDYLTPIEDLFKIIEDQNAIFTIFDPVDKQRPTT